MNNSIFRNKPVKLFLVGAMLGGGTALLLAPQAGVRTRRMIRRKAQDTAGFLTEAGHEMAAKYQGLRKGIGQALRRSRLAVAA